MLQWIILQHIRLLFKCIYNSLSRETLKQVPRFRLVQIDPQRRETSASWALSSSYRHSVVFSIHNLDYLALSRVSQDVSLTRNKLKLIESNLGTSRRSLSS